jgi:glycine oxidase
MSSVLVVGGGVIGCASALALAQRGHAVTVLERGAEPREAPGATGVSTWAAAGIVGGQVATRADGPVARLAIQSRALQPKLAATIRELTGQDVQLREGGILRPAFSADELRGFLDEAAWHEGAGLRIEHLDAATALSCEPALSPDVHAALRFPDDARIDPPSLLAGLRAAMVAAGATLRLGAEVRRVLVEGGAARGVELADGTQVPADTVVLAAGSWSSLVGGTGLAADAVAPARGQIVELRLERQILRGVVDGAGTYLSPRDDGRVLVGSTFELRGFALGATAQVTRDLLSRALRMVPALGDAVVTRAWAGFRPYVRDELPLLGLTATRGLILATGHFRNGVVLAPITAEIVAALVEGRAPPADIAPFSPSRLG